MKLSVGRVVTNKWCILLENMIETENDTCVTLNLHYNAENKKGLNGNGHFWHI